MRFLTIPLKVLLCFSIDAMQQAITNNFLQSVVGCHCVLCDKFFLDQRFLAEHMTRMHGVAANNSLMDQEQPQHNTFEISYLIIRAAKHTYYRCRYCSKEFGSLDSFNGHLSRNHT